jgi:hypothetical protein
VFERDIQEGVFDFEDQIHGLLGSPILTPLEYFRWRQLKENDYAVPLRAFKDLVARFLSVVTMVDTDILRRIEENAVSALTESTETTYRIYEVPMVRSFGSLRHLTVTCI